jgi:exodeoxyribonuclease V alpha subunit
MQRGVVGAANSEHGSSTGVEPTNVHLNRGGYTFRQGDRVMQLHNDYDKDVFNGDMGTTSGGWIPKTVPCRLI